MSKISVEEWLANLPSNVQTITRELRAVARRNMPKAHEIIYHDAIGYSVSDSPFDRICYVALQKRGYVNFGFFFAPGLPDPEKLLISDRKRLRHVKVWTVEKAKNLALSKLIVAMRKEAPQSIANVHARRKNSKQ